MKGVMKGKRWKRYLSAGLAVGLAMGLCACGKGGGKSENSDLAKQNVYRLEEFELPDLGGDDFNIQATAHKDGKVYLIVRVYHYDDGSDDNDIRVISMNEDGSDLQATSLEIPKWERDFDPDDLAGSDNGDSGDSEDPDAGIAPLAEPMIDETARTTAEEESASEEEPEGEGSSEASTEGEDPEGEGAEGEDPAGEGEGADNGVSPEVGTMDVIDEEYEGGDIWENTYFSSYTIGTDGKIYAVRSYHYEDGGRGIYVEKEYFDCWEMDGSFVRETELEGIHTDEEYLYINTMAAGKDGAFHFILTGDNTYKMSVDSQGNVSDKSPMSDELTEIFNNCDRIIPKEDGTLLILYYGSDDWSKEFLVSYDFDSDVLGEPAQMPASFSWNGYNTMDAGVSSDLVCSNSQGVFTFKAGDEAVTEKMNYVNSDIYVQNFAGLIELDEKSFIGVFYEDYEEGLKAGRFTYVDPSEIPDKSVLVMAGSYVGSDIKKKVVEYNRNSDKYRIVVKDYDSFNSYDDWNASVTQLNNDIITGNMPDILIASGLPVEQYISKGLMADIGKLIEEDEELSQVEFVQNVFDAYSVEGKLYYVIPSFSVSTMIGKTSIVGDRTSWTMADMQELKSTLPEETEMIGELTRSGFFNTMMQFCGRDYIDVDTGKCAFDSQNFIDMMEYAKTLPEELTEDYYGEEFWASYESRYREDKVILSQLYISSIKDTNYTLNGSFGEDISYIGFPTENGMGSYVEANSMYVISNKSSYIDGAWEFLRYYLTDEYQSELEWGMPVQMKYFNEKAQEALERPYYLDENGEKVEYDNYYYMNGEEIKIEPLSQEQIDGMKEFIFSVNKCYYYNENIMNIINEEMEAFFSGQKSAQEVARVIQNRAQIYVDENR